MRPIDVRHAVARRRLDQAAQPHARAEDEFRVARLVAASARAECRQDRSIAAVATDREIVQAQIGQRAAQLAHRRDDRVAPWPSSRNVSSLRSSRPLSSRGHGMPCRTSKLFPASALNVRPSNTPYSASISRDQLHPECRSSARGAVPASARRSACRCIPWRRRRPCSGRASSARGRSMLRQHRRQQRSSACYVGRAVIEDCSALVFRPRPAAQDAASASRPFRVAPMVSSPK